MRPAFEAEDRHALIRQVTQEEPRPLRQVDPTIPRDLETIVHTAIAKDPKDRYATAADLRDELERFLADRPIRSRPVSPPERYWRWCKRNPLLALASSAACVLRDRDRGRLDRGRRTATAGWPASSRPSATRPTAT